MTEKKENWAFPEKRGPNSIPEVRDRALSSARPRETGFDLDGEESVWVYCSNERCEAPEGKCVRCKPVTYGKNEILAPHTFTLVKRKQIRSLRTFAKRRGNTLVVFPLGFKPGK